MFGFRSTIYRWWLLVANNAYCLFIPTLLIPGCFVPEDSLVATTKIVFKLPPTIALGFTFSYLYPRQKISHTHPVVNGSIFLLAGVKPFRWEAVLPTILFSEGASNLMPAFLNCASVRFTTIGVPRSLLMLRCFSWSFGFGCLSRFTGKNSKKKGMISRWCFLLLYFIVNFNLKSYKMVVYRCFAWLVFKTGIIQ